MTEKIITVFMFALVIGARYLDPYSLPNATRKLKNYKMKTTE